MVIVTLLALWQVKMLQYSSSKQLNSSELHSHTSQSLTLFYTRVIPIPDFPVCTEEMSVSPLACLLFFRTKHGVIAYLYFRRNDCLMLYNIYSNVVVPFSRNVQCLFFYSFLLKRVLISTTNSLLMSISFKESIFHIITKEN